MYLSLEIIGRVRLMHGQFRNDKKNNTDYNHVKKIVGLTFSSVVHLFNLKEIIRGLEKIYKLSNFLSRSKNSR